MSPGEELLTLMNQHYSDIAPATATPIGSPISVADLDTFAWDEECDLLVIGLGCAGAATTLKASELGVSDIIVVDRFSGGGTSMSSGGVVYAGGGTRMQAANGFDDTPEAMFDYLMQEVGEARSPATVRRFTEASHSMIEWLESHELVFAGQVAPKKTSHPPAGLNLYYTGNEKVPAYADKAPPAPRGHRPEPPEGNPGELMGGVILMTALLRAVARAEGVRTLFQSACRRLIVHEGQVVGAEIWRIPNGFRSRLHKRLDALSNNPRLSAVGVGMPMWRLLAKIERAFAKPIHVRARSGVALCSGGHINNPLICAKAAPAYKGAARLGTIGDDGTALRLGHSVGARVARLGQISAWKFICPPTSWVRGIMVSAAGQRFVNEELYGAQIGDALFQKAGGQAWLVFDDETYQEAMQELECDPMWGFQRLGGRVAMQMATKADTLERLEQKLGMPLGGLTRSVSDFNRLVELGEPDPFGRGDEYRRPIRRGPFYALNQSGGLKTNPIPSITLGGLEVDESTNAVLDGNGMPIPGLFAAGRAAVGICSENYVSGLSLADCIWSGWQVAASVAGRNS